MALRVIAVSAVSTFLSFVGLQFCTDLSLEKLRSDGLIGWNLIHLDDASQDIELPSGLYTTIGLLLNCMINLFVLLNLCIKAVFFSELYASETRKLIERLVNYVIYKGTFLPLIVPPTIYQAGLWSTWLTVLCSLKMFQALARDRLERLNASPSATPWTYLRVYSALLFVFMADVFWIRLCLTIYRTHRSSMYLLLFFEPFSIAFETLQAILVHGFQLLDIWLHHSACNSSDFRTPKLLNTLTAGSLLEWKGILIRNLGFFLDMATFFMALGHYLYIWRLHGMAFHLVDAVLFLNIRALLSAIVNRIKGFIKLRIALGTLHAALPDATTEELRAYDDECAICREPMAKAKKLNCNHLLYLACLRSWLDQGLTDIYTCPTCRKPLFEGVPQNEASSDAGTISSDQQLARQISAGLDRPNPSRHTMPTGLYPNQTLNTPEGVTWRGAGLDSEDTLQLLFQASNSSNLEKSLEILIQNAKSDSGRLELASKRILPAVLNIVQSLAQASHHHHHNQTFSLCFKLLRNLCAGEAANQVSFIELNGVAVVWSVLRSEAGSLGPDHRLVRWGLQVLANVSLGGKQHQRAIWEELYPIGFASLARVGTKEICDPLCMVIYTCCDGNPEWFKKLSSDDGWPVVAEIVRTASSASFDEDWLKLLLSRIFLEESQLPVLFSKLQSVDVPEGEVIESKNGQFSFEQAFLLEILSEILNERLGDVTVSKDVVLFVFGIFKKSIGVLEHAMRGKSGLPSGFTGVDVLGYSLTILRDICAQDGMRGNTKDVVDVLLSYGLIEFLLSLLGALEPPAISRKGLKQIENQDNASCCSKPCPYKGFRRDIVALIGNCVYRRKHAKKMGPSTLSLSILFLLSLCIAGTVRSDDDCVYTAYIRTGSVVKGGTDSKIGIKLYDKFGYYIYIKNLEAWGGLMGKSHNYFERGNLDIFSGTGPCLEGAVCAVNVTSDGSGSHHGWYLNYVEVTSTGPHATCAKDEFEVEQWLALDTAPYQIWAVRNHCRYGLDQARPVSERAGSGSGSRSAL